MVIDAGEQNSRALLAADSGDSFENFGVYGNEAMVDTFNSL